MKKALVAALICVSVMATLAYGDIGVSWKSTDFMYYDLDSSGTPSSAEYAYVNAGATYHQLLWSPNLPNADPMLVVGTVSALDTVGTTYSQPWGTEYLLKSGTTTASDASYGRFVKSGSTINPYPTAQFDDGDVGSADINTGYLYSRLFSDTTLGLSTRYYQNVYGASTPGVLPVYDPQDPQNNLPISYDSTPLTPDNRGNPYNLQMVPEPSTLALLGLGVVTLALRRRVR